MDKKTLSIATALVLAIGFGIAGFHYFPKMEKGSEVTVGDEQTSYEVTVSSNYSTAKQDDVILDLAGTLLVHEQATNQLVSEWSAISSLTVMNVATATEDILNFPAVSALEQGEMVHYVQADFPQAYSGFQKEILSRFFLPIPIRAAPEIYHTEREGKNLFRVKYLVSEINQGFEVTRSWIQNLQGDIETDPKANGFHYQYNAEGKLLSMSGTLTFIGTDHENLPFRLTTKITMNKGETKTLAADKKVYQNPRDMIVAEAQKPVRQDSDKLRPIKEVFEAVDNLTAEDTPQDRADLYLEMAKILSENPDTLSEFKSKVLSMDAGTGQSKFQMNLIFSVLAGSETAAGSEVLADLFSTDCKIEFCREMAISAYGMHSNVSLDSAQKVLHVAETDEAADMAFNAYLGAGAAGRILGDRFAELRPSLLKAAKAADEDKDFTKKALIVRAIGNTGDRAFLPVLTEGIKSEDHLTKNMSYYALRFIPGDDVNDLLVHSLETEANELTATEIIRSAGLRQFSKAELERLGEKVPTWGENDSDLTVNTVNILLTAYHRNPEDSEKILESLKGRVKSKDLKAYIEAGMNPLGPTPDDAGNVAEEPKAGEEDEGDAADSNAAPASDSDADKE